MTYEQLVAQHERIARLLQELMRIINAGQPRPKEASALLSLLAGALGEHLQDERPMMRRTLGAAARDRHADLARDSAAELTRLQDDWSDYLRRWTEPAVVAHWPEFVLATKIMTERLSDRVEFETAVLYSLALHYNVIEAKVAG